MENHAKSLYNYTAKFYDRRHNNDATRHLRKRELELLRKYAHGFILDVGCGTGVYAGLFENYTGMDISKRMINEAMKKSKKLYAAADAEKIPFKDGSFDSVICMFTVLNLCDYRKAVKEMHRALKKNGRLIVSVASVWDRKNYSFWTRLNGRFDSDVKNVRIEKDRLRFRLFTKDELIKIFQYAGFELLEFHGVYKWQEPYWNRYVKFGMTAKIKLVLERLLPSKTGRIYIAVFRKV
ncbi:MAG: class I SAM-dependent methyltransferase [Candidatus Aenigmarchaeota archaeon]|nr:class I SAM-dependent methyltransferase [Candidatus Aenigmarchaeota archaeon]